MSDSDSRNAKDVAVRNRAEDTSGHPNQIIVQTGSSVVKTGPFKMKVGGEKHANLL